MRFLFDEIVKSHASVTRVFIYPLHERPRQNDSGLTERGTNRRRESFGVVRCSSWLSLYSDPVPTIALTHLPSPRMNACIRTHAAHEEIDVARANAQHEAYRRALAAAGAEVRVLDVNREYADAVFIEDTAIVLDELAVITSMGAASRREEPRAIEEELARLRRTVVRIEPPATIEGGDVVRVGRTILVGRTGRTNDAGIDALRSHTAPYAYEVIAVDVRDCLHLKTACTALPDDALLVHRTWLADPAALSRFELVDVAEGEPHAANVVVVGANAVMSSTYPRTAAIARKHARELFTVDLSEFAKGDGCATCLSLLVEVP